MTRLKLIAGNWKMNGLSASLGEAKALRDWLAGRPRGRTEAALFPPATLLSAMSVASGGVFATGGQDCHAAASGAFTGDLSAAMLKDAGAKYVLAGHSERRTLHGESSDIVHAKAEAALAAGLVAVVCVGETLAQRETGQADSFVSGQLLESLPVGATPENVVIAYEPVWAIGTGRVASTADIQSMHAALRASLRSRFGEAADGFRILYGGSVKPDNAADILALPDVDGALVGGASLKAADFIAIIAAAPGV